MREKRAADKVLASVPIAERLKNAGSSGGNKKQNSDSIRYVKTNDGLVRELSYIPAKSS